MRLHDGTDLSQLEWRRNGYALDALSNLYTADDARLRLILRELAAKVTHLESMRALGFCVSVEHARWMARKFVAAGLRAAALDASSPRDERAEQIRRLRAGELQILFAVDLFNEGLDIPEIDTVLFLRPTESHLVFLQQLGRGLRLCPGKSCLTVLGQKTQPASARPTATSASTCATAPCSAAAATNWNSRSKRVFPSCRPAAASSSIWCPASGCWPICASRCPAAGPSCWRNAAASGAARWRRCWRGWGWSWGSSTGWRGRGRCCSGSWGGWLVRL